MTLVFTDVQGSTTQWEMHPLVMEKALEMHDKVMRSHIEEFTGYEVKTEGDAFFISFERPEDAIRFCFKVQVDLLKEEWAEDVFKHPDAKIEASPSGAVLYRGLRVRMGVHTGEPTCAKNPVTGGLPPPDTHTLFSLLLFFTHLLPSFRSHGLLWPRGKQICQD